MIENLNFIIMDFFRNHIIFAAIIASFTSFVIVLSIVIFLKCDDWNL